jgi:hypothetical protein
VKIVPGEFYGKCWAIVSRPPLCPRCGQYQNTHYRVEVTEVVVEAWTAWRGGGWTATADMEDPQDRICRIRLTIPLHYLFETRKAAKAAALTAREEVV